MEKDVLFHAFLEFVFYSTVCNLPNTDSNKIFIKPIFNQLYHEKIICELENENKRRNVLVNKIRK